MSDLAASVAFEVVRADHGEVSEVYFVTPRAAGEVSSGVDNLESNATRDTRLGSAATKSALATPSPSSLSSLSFPSFPSLLSSHPWPMLRMHREMDLH